MSSDEYLRPTPAIITSNTYIWNLCPGSKPAIMARLEHLYDNLKACPLLRNINKDPNPLWLNLSAQKYLTDEEKELYSFTPLQIKQESTVEDTTTSPSILQEESTQDAWTQTGLICREASPVSDFSNDSPIKSPKIFNISDSDDEIDPLSKKQKTCTSDS